MDDIAEQQDVANEISEAISNPTAFGHDVDEVSVSKHLTRTFGECVTIDLRTNSWQNLKSWSKRSWTNSC